jgi:hypothetical protein
MKNNWIKNKIVSHWDKYGKSKVSIYRNFKRKIIIIDFMNSGSCTAYSYDGKYIAG